MAVQQTRAQTSYGYPNPQKNLAPDPIIANRAPLASDMAAVGTEWIFQGAPGSVYFNTGNIAGSANWVSVSGGAGVFSSLTVNPGPTNLSTVGNGAVTIGNATNTGAITLVAGTGNLAINGAGHQISVGSDAFANNIFVGTRTAGALLTLSAGNGVNPAAAMLLQTADAGDIQIGLPTQTGAIYLGVSTAGQIVNINSAANAGAQVVNIANGGTLANSTVNILSGAGTVGAGVLAMANNPRVTTIDLGNIAPAAARTTTLAGGGSAVNDTVSVLNGIMTANTQAYNLLSGNSTGGTQTVNILNGTNTGTTQSFNLMTNSTAGASVNIATANIGHVVTVGNANAASSLIVNSGLNTRINSGRLELATSGVNPIYVYTGNGAPGAPLAVHIGDLYVRTDAGAANERMYIATAAGTWTNVTCAA